VRPALKRDAALLFGVSLILSLALWLQVGFQNGFVSSREFSVRLQLRGVPEDLIVTEAPRELRVVAEGSTASLDALNPEAVSAEVDLRGAAAGRRSHPVTLNVPTRPRLKFTPRATFALVTLEPVARLEQRVTVQARGTRPLDLRYDGAALEPETVEIVGPQSSIAEVRRVQATLDLAGLRPGTSFVLDVEVLDARNRPIPFVHAEPGQVTVFPAVAAAPATANVPINPVWRGHPQFGYQIVRWDMRPSQVELTGDSGALALVEKVDTEPVDLTGLNRATTRTVRLRIPAGLRATGGQTVRVSLDIQPAPPQPGPAPGAPES
jgi:YbbR domain-containing protein